MGCLLDALEHAWRKLGFDPATAGDEVFRQLVLARIIEPVSKLDSARVLEEAGVPPVPYRTSTRRLRVFAQDSWRHQISAACAAHARLGPASLVLHDVSTLYFETDAGGGFRQSGFSKERRLEPQITIGLLTDQAGFPLGSPSNIRTALRIDGLPQVRRRASRPVGRVLCTRRSGPTAIHLGLPLPTTSCGLPASIGRAALKRSRSLPRDPKTAADPF
jgi:hypothetical protein